MSGQGDEWIEATMHGGPFHGQMVKLPPEAWQRGSFRVIETTLPARMIPEDGELPATRSARYTRVHGRLYDFEYVGSR